MMVILGTTNAQVSPPGNPNPLLYYGQQAGDLAKLPRFDLDFEGGTPQQLVETIRAQIKVLNAIIPPEHANVQLPPLMMKQVNVYELFTALTAASQSTQIIYTDQHGRTSVANARAESGFRTQGAITPESVWHFFTTQPAQRVEKKEYRFYQLSPYLGTLTVEDITTAIQAGWKMMGETNTPALNFHKETKLLIAVGRADQLTMINSVLAELPKNNEQPAGAQQPVQTPSAPKNPQPAPL